MRKVVASLALGAVFAFVAVTSVSAAEETRSFDVGVAACEHASTEQLCTPISTVSVTTNGVLRVEFVASAAHCSSVIAHLFLDGTERFVSGPLAAGQGTGAQEFGPVASGAHSIGVQAEGVVGGCNTGATGSWLGTLSVVVSTSGPTSTAIVISGLLGLGMLGVGAVVVYELRKTRVSIAPLASPSGPVAPLVTQPNPDAALAAPPDPVAPLDAIPPGDTRDTLDALGSEAELDMLKLQQTVSERGEAVSMASNVLKKIADTVSRIIANMGK